MRSLICSLEYAVWVYVVVSGMRLIGQNVLVKTAVTVEISTAAAVISFLGEDTGWTKCVGKNRYNH